MFIYNNTGLIQPKPIKFYDLHEALILLQTNAECREYCASKIPVRIARAAKPEIEESIRLPLHRRIIGRPVKDNVEVVKKHQHRAFSRSSEEDAEARCSLDQRICPPWFTHLRSFVRTRPVWNYAPSPSQVPLLPTRGKRNEAQMSEPKTISSYEAEEWTERTQVPRVLTPVWMRAPSPSELPPPPKSGSMINKVEGYYIEDSESECYETASEGTSEAIDEGEYRATGLPSASAEGFDSLMDDKGSVHDSGYSSASPHSTPSSSTSDLHHCRKDVDAVKSKKLHWNISMGVDVITFLLDAEHELQKKTMADTRMTGTTVDTHKGEGSCLHWNRSMGGDAMSFLLGAESKLRRKAKGKERAMPCGVV